MTSTKIVNLVAKGALVVLLLHAVLFPDLPQYHGKGIGFRLGLYPLSTLVVPAIWLGLRQAGRARGAYPHLVDLCVCLPFLIDTAGNAANLYDTIAWWDDAMHTVTWVPLVVAFGLSVRRLPLGRLNVAALTLGFGSVTHVIWEVLEYLTFIRGNANESATAYSDTIGDLVMSMGGSLLGAALVSTVLWNLGDDESPARSGRSALVGTA